ncbi:hypothetical protein C8J56DRAFT_904051 [Mycena floridula]|nr:hypothetical protein C8J56DRAFT_904051 [Mycena floridula]
MSRARHGRKPKQHPNMSGLRNRSPVTEVYNSTIVYSSTVKYCTRDATSSPEPVAADVNDLGIRFDSTRIDWERDEEGVQSDVDSEEELDVDDIELEWFGESWRQWLQRKRRRMLIGFPTGYKKLTQRRLVHQYCFSHAQSYDKSPDVINKSKSTAYCHQSAFETQERLDGFGFTNTKPATSTLGPKRMKAKTPAFRTSSQAPRQSPHNSTVPTRAPSPITVESSPSPRASTLTIVLDADASDDDIIAAFSVIPQRRRATESPEVSDDETRRVERDDEPENSGPGADLRPGEEEAMAEAPLPDEDAEVWEEELDENVWNPSDKIKDWATLRKQIKDKLKRKSKSLPLGQINQLLIICNFAMLRLKGLSRIQASIEIARQWHKDEGNWFACRVRALAHHYQIFEQLPVERRGGTRMARSWLMDERVKHLVLEYLNNIPAGKVTPRALQRQVNTIIFRKLEITPKSPISLRTACRWLIKLGWTYSLIKKGVYMDGVVYR